MLRITRRVGERIILGDDVIIEVMEVSGQTVRLGIGAPRSLSIYREEIWLEAAAHQPGSLREVPTRLLGTAPRPLRAPRGSGA